MSKINQIEWSSSTYYLNDYRIKTYSNVTCTDAKPEEFDRILSVTDSDVTSYQDGMLCYVKCPSSMGSGADDSDNTLFKINSLAYHPIVYNKYGDSPVPDKLEGNWIMIIYNASKIKTGVWLGDSTTESVTGCWEIVNDQALDLGTGHCSIVSGDDNTASGKNSQAFGTRTNATHDNEFACGKWNSSKEDSNNSSIHTMFTVGTGSGSIGGGNTTKNAIEVWNTGEVYINGLGGFTGNNTQNAVPVSGLLTGANKIVVLTAEEYAAIETKDANTLYFIN